MPTAYLTKLPASEPAYLWRLYDGESEPQGTYLSVDLEDGEVTCDYNPEIGNAVPASVHHGRTRRFDIPILPTAAANELLEAVLPLAQRMVDGAAIEWDGHNHVGALNDDAAAAEDEIRALIAGRFDRDDVQLVVYDVEEWFGPDDPEILNSAFADYGLTPDTTDAQLDEITARIQREAVDGGDPGATVVLTGVRDRLAARREQRRDDLRRELDQVGVDLAKLTERRDALIRQQVAWNTRYDSLRAIARRAGLSHNRVDQIGKTIPGGPNGEGYRLTVDGHFRKGDGTCYSSCPHDDHNAPRSVE